MSKPAAFTDIRPGLDRWLPPRLRPYARLARLDRPIGTWLLLFPCWWSAALAAERWPNPVHLILFAIGAVVMRGAGCTVNDILDRHIDAEVERTRTRPLPAGDVSVKQALAFLALQLLIGLAVLLCFNGPTIILGAASLVLVFTYPMMKRITWWPQAFLGLAFNWGALVGWSAARADLDLAPLLLYAGGIAWTLGYDTIYAHQDKEDDARIGVKSTARLLGDRSRPWVGGFHLVAIIAITGAGVAAGLGIAALPFLAAAAGLLVWHTLRWTIDDQEDCLYRFRANRWFGWLILAAMIAGRLSA